MLKEFFEVLKEGYAPYFASAFYPFVLVIGAVYICLTGKKTEKEKLVYLPLITMLLTICNPIYWKIVNMSTEYAYYRAYWNIPLFFIMACMMVYAVEKAPRKKSMTVGILAIVAVMIWGSGISGNFKFRRLENVYKFPKEVIEVAQILKENGAEGKIVLAPSSINTYLRQYDADIFLYVNSWGNRLHADLEGAGKSVDERYSQALRASDKINNDKPDYGELIGLNEIEKWDYLVLKKSQSEDEGMRELGLVCIANTNDYNVYIYDESVIPEESEENEEKE